MIYPSYFHIVIFLLYSIEMLHVEYLLIVPAKFLLCVHDRPQLVSRWWLFLLYLVQILKAEYLLISSSIPFWCVFSETIDVTVNGSPHRCCLFSQHKGPVMRSFDVFFVVSLLLTWVGDPRLIANYSKTAPFSPSIDASLPPPMFWWT